jgi:pimeloyl-ACP methyl ester carboxylesterase
MKKIISSLFILFGSLLSNPLSAFEQKVVQANGLEFWTESFGDKSNPAVLLIMGSGAQGLFWHQKFCEQLADKGFFVIRYDHRDVGLSSSIDYQKSPYTLLDMSKDAVAILDAYQIKKAHIVGMSLGGLIAMLIDEHNHDRVESLTLMMTSGDMRSNLTAIQGKKSPSSLSAPSSEFLAWIRSYVTDPPITPADRINKFIEGARIVNGSKVAYDEQLGQQLALQSFSRTKDPLKMFNHIAALDASFDLYKDSPSHVKAPTVIIHGDQDPVLPLDHAQALKKAIPQAELVVVQDMGHALNAKFYDLIIGKIVELSKK